jgi:hypothetical protein
MTNLAPSNSLFRPDNSLFALQKIPVPPGTGNAVQATENAEKFRAEDSPRGPFSCKFPVKIPVSRDFLWGICGLYPTLNA